MTKEKVVNLGSLKKGSWFQLADSKRIGQLLRISPASATVQWQETRIVKGQNRWGDEFAFSRKAKPTAIALTTLVVKIRKPRSP